VPLTDLQLTLSLRFTLEKLVSGWPNAVQGENTFVTTLSGVDLAEWSQVYAAVIPLAGAADTTIDLQSFTNLAGEAVVMDKVFGIFVKVTPDDSEAPDTEIVIEPGASNGLVWDMADVTVKADQTYCMVEDADNVVGTVVDATHKTLKLSNVGVDDATVTLIIFGGV
jgi:hypothetical protein